MTEAGDNLFIYLFIYLFIINIIFSLQKGEQRGHIITINNHTYATTHMQPHTHSHTSSPHDNALCSAKQTNHSTSMY